MVYAYIRISTADQSESSQEFEIRNWADREQWHVDKWIKESVSGTIIPSKRKLGGLMRRMRRGDTLLCTEISRLGRNMLMIMSILNNCAARGVRVRTIKDNFNLDDNINSKIIAFAFALAAEIERNLISQRTREALADKKAAGVCLGRPKGSFKAKTMVLQDIDSIRNRLKSGESKSHIAITYGIHRNTLNSYLKELGRF